MASITWTDVTNHAADLSTVTTAAQTDILAHVNTVLNVEMFGGETAPMLKLARVYLAAHYGAVWGQGAAGAAGPVVSEGMGGLQRSYAWSAMTGDPDSLSSTAYGKAFRSLVRSTLARMPMVI